MSFFLCTSGIMGLAPKLRVEKEINDVFEYMPLGSILHPSSERRAIVLDDRVTRNPREINRFAEQCPRNSPMTCDSRW